MAFAAIRFRKTTRDIDSKEVQPGPGERLDITFDLLGRLIVCEGDDRRLTRMGLDGKVESLVDNYKGAGASTGRPTSSVTRTGVYISPIQTSAVIDYL